METITPTTAKWSLTGEFTDVSVDDKGRVTIPATLRQILKPNSDDKITFVISRSNKSNALRITPKTSEVETHLNEHPDLCFLFDTASTDAAHRLSITAKKLQSIGLDAKSKAVLIGNGHRIELWNPLDWAKEKEKRLQEAKNTQDGVEYVI